MDANAKENDSALTLECGMNIQTTMDEGDNNEPVGTFLCTYCDLQFATEAELQIHCRSESHQSIIMSDDGREWKHRPPPRGLSADQYGLCHRYVKEGICRLGQQCCEAHSEDELAEWKERFSYRQMKVQRAKEKQLHGNLFTEQLLESWMQAQSPQKILKESLDYINLSAPTDLYCTMSAKRSAKEWTFTLKSKVLIHHVALLNDVHRTHFLLTAISCNYLHKMLQKNYDVEINCQEWTNPDYIPFVENMDLEYKIKVSFKTEIFGTFRQTAVFDYGRTPVLAQRLCVDVLPVAELDKLMEMRDTVLSSTSRWNDQNIEVVPFEPRPIPLSEEDVGLLNFYSAPHLSKLMVTQSVMDKSLTKENYTSRLHELLAIEELAQYEQISRFNMLVKLQLISRYMLAPCANSVAKYSANRELFARMKLNATLSEDTLAGRLVLSNCTTALIASSKPIMMANGETNHKVYEALIEDKGKNFIYLRMSEQCVLEMNLQPDQDFQAEVQFQLNRLPLCEMHYAIDKLPNLNLVFPNNSSSPYIPWNTQRQWSDSLDSRLNPKQKEAIVAITTPVEIRLPPVLLIGPYGTGKTFTLAQAVKQIIQQNNTRVLICTHSNSAADLYIREYLHPYVCQGQTEAHPLRIYYRNRWVQTVHPTVLQYCLLVKEHHSTTFRVPTIDDIMQHRVVVATLSTSRYLAHLGLPKGFFTHILIDEAAQAMECEVIMPLALADADSRIVLAGDHMQLSPEIYSPFAKSRGLQLSLLERLYDAYPPRFSCCILLCENYRSHEAIIQYTSELFYDSRLVASGKQPRHEVFYPLTFFTARGEDVHEQNSTAFYNNSEVYEIVERVCELQKMWPKSWGKQDDSSIGIVAPYADQVFRIRAEFRKRRMAGISVERVLNVQGKQFRAVFLSTVRTRHTCTSQDDSEEIVDYGFLSNAKLLNTAITRAQSLVAVVGDPISLCSIGKCRKLWERFIEVCHTHKSLHGITWSSIRAQLDGVELKKTYVLNPLAPEFVPNRLRHGEPYLQFNSYIGPHGQHIFSSSPSWLNTRYYYSSHLYPHHAAAPPPPPPPPQPTPGPPVYSYSYPLSYLYGLRPSYVGAPVMLNNMNISAGSWNVGGIQGLGKRGFYYPVQGDPADKSLVKKMEKDGDKAESPQNPFLGGGDFAGKAQQMQEKLSGGGIQSPNRQVLKGSDGRGVYVNGIQPDILKAKKGKMMVIPLSHQRNLVNFGGGGSEKKRGYGMQDDKFFKGKDWDWKDGTGGKGFFSARSRDAHLWQKNSMCNDSDGKNVNKQYQFLPGVHLPPSSSSSMSSVSSAEQNVHAQRYPEGGDVVDLKGAPPPKMDAVLNDRLPKMPGGDGIDAEQQQEKGHHPNPMFSERLHYPVADNKFSYCVNQPIIPVSRNMPYYSIQERPVGVVENVKLTPLPQIQNCPPRFSQVSSAESQMSPYELRRANDVVEWAKTVEVPHASVHPLVHLPPSLFENNIVQQQQQQPKAMMAPATWKVDVPEVPSLLPLSGMTVKELEANLLPMSVKERNAYATSSAPNEMYPENSVPWSMASKASDMNVVPQPAPREYLDLAWPLPANPPPPPPPQQQQQADALPLYLRCNIPAENHKMQMHPDAANIYQLNEMLSKNLSVSEPGEAAMPQLANSNYSKYPVDANAPVNYSVPNDNYERQDMRSVVLDSPPDMKPEGYHGNGFPIYPQAPLTYAGVVRATPPKQNSPLESIIKEASVENAFNRQSGLYKYFY